MYNTIINPLNNKSFSIFSNQGKTLLKSYIKEFNGILSRVIQHEYDHIQGILFTDKISPLKRKIIEKKLSKISKGNINPNYKMLFNK